MDPSAPRPSAEKLESWLRYYEDLGIRSFYLDRAAAVSPVAQAIPEASQEPMPKSKSPSAPKSVAPPASASGVARLPGIVQGPSLFEAADRVEGDSLERISSDLGDCTR